MGGWSTRLEQLPVASPPPSGRIVVLSAHPDDEVLAVGAWLAGLPSRECVFVTATDGEASHPDSPTTTRDELRSRRPAELRAALAALGLRRAHVQRLGLPDGGLADDPVGLVAAVEPWVAGAALVLAPFEQDGHPDHDALGEAALVACGGTIPLWRFPIWTWAWSAPAHQEWLARARRLPEEPDARSAKSAAIQCFLTQAQALSDDPADAAIFTDELLAHALHGPEVVLT